MSKWAEIRNDFYDEEEQKVYIDAWLTDDGDEEGIVIAKVNYKTKVIEYLDNEAKTDCYAQEIINEILNKIDNGDFKKEEILNATNIVCLNCVEDTLNNEDICDSCPVRKLCESLEVDS